jgi:hypothetical protein
MSASLRSRPNLCTAANRRGGRVEDGRGSLGHAATLRFPSRSSVGSRTGAPVEVEVCVLRCLALSFASVTPSRPCHVSSPRHVERSMRISRTTLPCLFRPKARLGELLCGGALQQVLQPHQRLGGKEGSAPYAARSETKGLRLDTME